MSKLCARRPRALPTPKPPTLSEKFVAIGLVDYVNTVHRSYASDLIKIDNENKCSLREGASKKRQGKRKGASDYFLAVPVEHGWQGDLTSYNGLWLEIKKKGGKESPEQKEFGLARARRGYAYRCAYGLDEAIKVIEWYLGKK